MSGGHTIVPATRVFLNYDSHVLFLLQDVHIINTAFTYVVLILMEVAK